QEHVRAEEAQGAHEVQGLVDAAVVVVPMVVPALLFEGTKEAVHRSHLRVAPQCARPALRRGDGGVAVARRPHARAAITPETRMSRGPPCASRTSSSPSAKPSLRKRSPFSGTRSRPGCVA